MTSQNPTNPNNPETMAMTSTSTAIAKYDALTREEINLLKETIAKGASDIELALFVRICNRTGLDPFARQIYMVKRKDEKLGKEVMTTQISIDGSRLTADRSKKYNGQTKPEWCGKDGVWKDVWLADEPPAAARVGVYRKGAKEPIWGVALWKEYAQKFWNKEKREWYFGTMWKKFPTTMLAKCAESLALRKAFPQELSGLYTQEETGQLPTHAETDESFEGVTIDGETGEVKETVNPEPKPKPEAKHEETFLNDPEPSTEAILAEPINQPPPKKTSTAATKGVLKAAGKPIPTPPPVFPTRQDAQAALKGNFPDEDGHINTEQVSLMWEKYKEITGLNFAKTKDADDDTYVKFVEWSIKTYKE